MPKKNTLDHDNDRFIEKLQDLYRRMETETAKFYGEFVETLGEALRERASGKDYFPVALLREQCRQFSKALAAGAEQRTVFYIAESDALLYAMAGGHWRESVQIARALAELLASYGAADRSKELLLRLHYLAGLPWQEIGQIEDAKDRIGDPIRAAAALGEDLERVGLSHELLRKQYLQPKGAVTSLLADVRDGRRFLGDVLARDRARLQGMAGNLLRLEKTASWQATDLVNELFVRLPRDPGKAPVNEREMRDLTRRIMKHILTDRARKKIPGRGRRRGEMPEDVPLKEKPADAKLLEQQVVAATKSVIDEFWKTDPAVAEILEAAYYRSTEQKEIARLLGVSVATVKRRIQDAKALIRKRLGLEEDNGRSAKQARG